MNRQKGIRQQLVKYGRRLSQAGFIIGSGGNISVRRKRFIYLKAKNVNMSEAKQNDYIAFNIDIDTARQNASLLSSEYRMHILCYQRRHNICAIIHTHPAFCVALSSKINILKSSDYEILANIGMRSVRIIPYIKPGTSALALAVSRVIEKDNAVILKHHGLICVGRSLEEAFVLTQAIERASLIYILRKLWNSNS